MRKVFIDLCNIKENYWLGYAGEHEMTILQIKLNEELAKADSFSLKFSICGTAKVISDLEAEAGVITYILPQNVTGILLRQCQVLIQVIGYIDGALIAKSSVINAELDEAITDIATDIDPAIIDLEQQIGLNTSCRHKHENKNILDDFSTNEKNELLYKGQVIKQDIDLNDYLKWKKNPSSNNIVYQLLSGDTELTLAAKYDYNGKNIINTYATKEELPDVPTKVSELENDKGYLSEHQSLAGYARIEDIPTNVSRFNNDAGYLTEHQSLEGYARLTDIPEVPTKVSAFENDKGYLTEHQSLEEYVKKSEIPSAPVKTSQLINDSDYTTKNYVDTTAAEANRQIERTYAKKTELPDVPTKVSAFTNDAGYLTEHQSLAEYAKTADIPTKTSDLTNDSGYLTEHQSLADYPTNEDIEALGEQFNQNIDNKLKSYAKKSEIPTVPTKTSQLTNDSGFLTEHQSLEGLATDEDIANVIEVAEGKTATYIFDTVDDLDTWLDNKPEGLRSGDVFLIRDTGVPDYWYDADNNTKQIMETSKMNLNEYAKKTDLPTKTSDLTNDSGYLTEHQSLEGLATKEELTTATVDLAPISAVTTLTDRLNNNYYTSSQINTTLNSYAKKTDIPTVPTKTSDLTNDSGFLTEHQSLSEYAKKTEIPTVPTNVSAFTNDSGYLTEHQSLTEYAKKTEIPTVPTNVSAFTNDSGYLTSHQSLAEYAKKTDIPTTLPANGGNAHTTDNFHFEKVVGSLPTTVDNNTIYFIV